MGTLDIDWLTNFRGPIETGPRIEAGAHLVSDRDGYAHHGIYAGNGLVIHYGGFYRSARRCPVECVPLCRFAVNRVPPVSALAQDIGPDFRRVHGPGVRLERS